MEEDINKQKDDASEVFVSTPIVEEKKKNNHLLLWFTLILIVMAIVWFFYWFLYLQYHEYTDDAYANGNIINVNSAINGSVIGFFADDTDKVVQGQLLVKLDDTQYRVVFENELAALASIVLQVRQLYDNVQVNRAIIENRKTMMSKAKFDYENRLDLIGSKAVSNEEFIHSRDDLSLAESNLKQAEEQLKVSEDARGNTSMMAHPLILEQKAKVRKAFYNLQHCSIFAPATGFIAKRNVNVGQWVTPVTNMMAIIPTDYVWVDANFKETQLTYMRVGQPAKVSFDLYGSHVEFEGKVLGIASGTGSAFSLIPPQNATGNWIKIVQRLPVRISLNPELAKKYPIRVGISAEVDVDLTDQNLPYLTQVTSKKPIEVTSIFEINFEKLDELMDQIIQDNLRKDV